MKDFFDAIKKESKKIQETVTGKPAFLDEINELKSQKEQTEAYLENLEESLAAGKLKENTYNSTKSRYEAQLNDINGRLEPLLKEAKGLKNTLEIELERLQEELNTESASLNDLLEVYSAGGVSTEDYQKQKKEKKKNIKTLNKKINKKSEILDNINAALEEG